MIEIVHTDAWHVHGLVLIKDGAAWWTFARPWWDLASWLWWALTPGRKQWVMIRSQGKCVRVRSVRLAPSTLRVGS